MKFLNNSNLPESRVTLCAVNAAFPELTVALGRQGITCIPAGPNPCLPLPVACHPDMCLCHLGGNEILVAKEGERENFPELARRLRTLGFKIFLCAPPAGRYPGDVKLNCLVLGSYILANKKTIDIFLTNRWCETGKVVIPVAQGYTKCAACIVDSHALITADPSIAKAARDMPDTSLTVLEIAPGQILLDGYETGFIGGCTGLLDSKLLAFTGSLDSHSDGGKIADFIKKRGVKFIELLKVPLTDVGSIIPLKEATP